LAGVIGNRAGQIDGSQHGDALFLDHFAGAGNFAVAAALGGQIHDHRAGRHAAQHLAVTSTGDFLPGTTAAAITTSLWAT
jgi:hypothetical protein